MKRLLGIFVAVIITFSAAPNAGATNLSDSQKQLDNINNSIDSKKDKLNEINKNTEAVKTQISSLDQQTSSAAGKLDEINGKLLAVNKDINSAELEIKQQEKNLKDRNVLFRERVKAMYTSGNISYIEVLIASDSFSDMITRFEYVKRIMDYDKNLIQQITKEKKAVEAKQQLLSSKRTEIKNLQLEADSKHQELLLKTSEKQKLMATLQKDKSYYEKMIAQEEKEAAEITTMIKNAQGSGSTVKPSGNYSCVTGRIYSITSSYGWRIHPILGTKKFHSGIDIGVGTGTPIYSLKNGVVTFSGQMSGYGNVVMVNHGDIITLYAHNSSLKASVGQKVSGGDVIAYSGSTGLSSGPHLHFEVRLASTGETINPASYYRR